MNREDGTISIEKVGTSYRAYFEYDKDFISWVKKDGHGSWNSAGRYWSLTAKGVLNYWISITISGLTWLMIPWKLQKPRLRLSRRGRAPPPEDRGCTAPRSRLLATPAEQRLAGIKPIERYDFKSTPYPHQIEAFNYNLKKGKDSGWPMSQDLVRQRSPSMHPIILKRLEKRKSA